MLFKLWKFTKCETETLHANKLIYHKYFYKYKRFCSLIGGQFLDLNNDLGDLDRLIKEYAPEIYEIWDKRADSSEEQGIRTGRLHENHILGILFKHLMEGEPEVTTTDIEEEYEIFFKKIARSTVSTYLNQLEKEEVLFKKRDGRAVMYLFNIPPPNNIDAFWT
jgi:hypothetical protein